MSSVQDFASGRAKVAERPQGKRGALVPTTLREAQQACLIAVAWSRPTRWIGYGSLDPCTQRLVELSGGFSWPNRCRAGSPVAFSCAMHLEAKISYAWSLATPPLNNRGPLETWVWNRTRPVMWSEE